MAPSSVYEPKNITLQRLPETTTVRLACDVIRDWHSHQEASDAASSEGREFVGVFFGGELVVDSST